MTPRAMLAQDLNAVVAIERAANRFPWSYRNFEDSLQSGHHAWVFCLQQHIIGYVIVQMVLDEAHLLNICVKPDYQGQGYGRSMLEFTIDFARHNAATVMILEVRASNIRAQQLYNQSGFNEMSIRKGYYPAEQGREDAILMGLDLDMLALFESD